MCEKDFLPSIPALAQRQDSLADQLGDLIRVANKLGMYDAADAVQQMFKLLLLDQSTIRYGCHVDLGPGEQPDGCVIDTNEHANCVYAKPGMRKEQCKYWKIVVM